MNSLKTSLLGLSFITCFAVGCADAAQDDADAAETEETASDLINESALAQGIVMNESIAGVKFLATAAQVKKVMGEPNRVENTEYIAGGEMKVFHYGKTTVDLVKGNGGQWVALAIETRTKLLKTTDGIGVGSTKAALSKAYPAMKCSKSKDWNGCSMGGEFFEKHTQVTFDDQDRVASVWLGATPD